MHPTSKIIGPWTGFALFVTTALLVAAPGAQADTIVYNSFGPGMTITPMGDTGTYTLGPPGTVNYFGAPFSPSATVDLTSLTGNWAAALTYAEDQFPLTNPAPITISVWTDSGGEPGTELESWALTVDQMATNYTLTTSSGPLLVAGDEYWVLADYTGAEAGDNFLGWALYSGGSSLGLWASDISATTMVLYTSGDPVLEVQGTPAVVPEPSMLLVLSVGFLVVLIKRRMTLDHS